MHLDVEVDVHVDVDVETGFYTIFGNQAAVAAHSFAYLCITFA